MVYPVGSIYIGTTNANPSTFIGGEWEAYGEGRTLVGAGTGTDVNSVERTFGANDVGGEYEHTLTVPEMPSHSHDIDNKKGIYGVTYDGYYCPAATNGTWGWAQPSSTMEIDATGGSQPHNNIQPYIVTYMWKRIN